MRNAVCVHAAKARNRHQELLRIVAKVVKLFLRAAPVFVNLDEHLEVDALAEELLESLACLCAHLLQGHALVSDDDAFLRVALNIDYRTYVYVALVFLERLHADLNRVRYLLVVIEQNLLAYYLVSQRNGPVCR